MGRAGRCYYTLADCRVSMPLMPKEFKNAKGLNGMTVFGIDSIDIIGVIVGLTLE